VEQDERRAGAGAGYVEVDAPRADEVVVDVEAGDRGK